MSRGIRVAGKPVVIIGAASGIGRALAQRLSGLGSPVAIADVDCDGLEKTVASLSGSVLSRVLDVRDAAGQLRFAGEVRSWLWDINFHGVVNGTRAFLPILAKQDSGAIVNTSSAFGLMGIPYQSAYCTSKFAVRGFTDSLRQELPVTGVRAITVHPGASRPTLPAARASARIRSAWAGHPRRWRQRKNASGPA